MASENQTQAPFWDFVRSMNDLHVDPNQRSGPPPPPPASSSPWAPWAPPARTYGNGAFGSGSSPWTEAFFGSGRPPRHWGHGGGGGRHHRRRRSHTPSSDGSRSPSPHRDENETAAAEATEEPRGPPGGPPPPHHGHPHSRSGREGRRGRRGGGHPRGPPTPGAWHHPPPPHRGPHGHGPPPPPFDINAFLQSLTSHPIAQTFLQHIIPQNRSGGTDTAPNTTGGGAAAATEDTNAAFTPPLDLFTTLTTWTLHIALPGAKKEDIGVHYSTTTSTLTISGVIYRPGSEEFLATMTSGERSVGLFERRVVLKGDEGGAVDEDGITAKLEDGVLVVMVPRVEKEWEDVKKVDIE